MANYCEGCGVEIYGGSHCSNCRDCGSESVTIEIRLGEESC